ncbi:TetR/AcrR family transcriptional regulator [Actinomadura kijaniata]|uniref:TetR/AcrR family transcriptional regulator n=1 Tax=Actinomadura kijaniata TaxID=46161 RepID=UPI003F199E63
MTTDRPLRADARRNAGRVLAAARETFAEQGPDASLNEIARRAGVGPGTLYRHFPNRRALQAAVLRDRVERLASLADELRAAPPAEALEAWLRAFLAHARTDHGLGGEALRHEPSDTGFDCHQVIVDTAAGVLDRARRAGAARPDARPGDLLRIVAGIALSPPVGDDDPGQAERLLALVLDAVRARAVS